MNNELSAMNERENKLADDTFFNDFMEQEALDCDENTHCFSNDGVILLEKITKDDILYNSNVYEYMNILSDEIEVSEYISDLRQIAKGFKLATDFDRKAKPYKTKALQLITERNKQAKADEKLKSYPKWFDGNNIDEKLFCIDFLNGREMLCFNSTMYDFDGIRDDLSLENQIYFKIEQYCRKDTASKVKKLLSALKIKCYSPPLPVDINTIHLKNGTLKTDGNFTTEKFFCTNRLNINIPSSY